MQNQLINFNYKAHNVRTVLLNGEPWWVLKDVCAVLGLAKPDRVAARLNPSEKGAHPVSTPGGVQEMTIVNEPGLYRVIFRSDKPEAADFQNWVYHEVLPQIRKTGGYGSRIPQTMEELTSPELITAVLGALNTQVEQLKARVDEQDTKLLVQGQQIAEMRPKATYYDLVLQSPDTVPMTVIAKDYGMSAKKLNALLHEWGVQFKQGGIWFLYQKYADCGYTQSKTHAHMKKDGTPGTRVHTYWTQPGRLFLYDTLKDHDILPLIERAEQETK